MQQNPRTDDGAENGPGDLAGKEGCGGLEAGHGIASAKAKKVRARKKRPIGHAAGANAKTTAALVAQRARATQGLWSGWRVTTR